MRDGGASGNVVAGVDRRQARDLDGAEAREIAAANPRPVAGGVEASVDAEGSLDTPVVEGLDMRTRRASGEQAARALSHRVDPFTNLQEGYFLLVWSC